MHLHLPTSVPVAARALSFLLTTLLIACSSDDKGSSTTDTSTPPDLSLPDIGDTTTPPPPDTGACVPLQPLTHSEPLVVVGDGSPESCTEAALRTAVDTLNAALGGTITFDCGGEHTLTLTEALYIDTGGGSVEDTPVIVDGGGLITLSGGESTRILDVNHYTDLVLQGLTLRDGFVAQEPDSEDPPNSGAALRHPWFGTLKIIDCHFENNHCASRDGEIGGGAVFAGGLIDAQISGSTFVGNSASNGGGLHNRGTNLTILNSVFRGNGALSVGDGQFGNGGGVYIDGMNYDTPGDLHVCGTRFEENTATQHGSGMFSFFYEGSASLIEHSAFVDNRFADPAKGSGGLYHQAVHLDLRSTTLSHHTTGEHAGGLFVGSGSSATITNCTFAHNTVTGNGAGLFNGASEVDLVNCTFTGNKADYGPAIFKGQNATMSLKNTLMVHNLTDNAFSATSCHAPLEDRGGNIQWPENKNNGNPDPLCAEGILLADPLLEPLADNGGVGQTAALGTGSPAIGHGSDCPEHDQRGEPRSGSCDSGAYQVP